MIMTENAFTQEILHILSNHYGEHAKHVFDRSELLQYINKKTVSANRGSKSRGSFANIYAIYVLVEDYINKGFHSNDKDYSQYEGATSTALMKRQRELPFGSKLQNHALNSRTNSEFEKYFPSVQQIPIIRDVASQHYWINEDLLNIKANDETFNICCAVIDIINRYVEVKQSSFKRFVSQCKSLQNASSEDPEHICDYLLSLLTPELDARLFEIVSYAILKHVYANQFIYWGYSQTNLNKERLKLYKTGRTNANDGGIDFVMKPLGRFFQATETMDFKKYFLDIDKLEHYPITFVIKSDEDTESILERIKVNAKKTYKVDQVVSSYMGCIEEIINIKSLTTMLKEMDKRTLNDVLDEIITQSRMEFNQ